MEINMKRYLFERALKGAIAMLAVFLLLSILTMLLWNYLMPVIANLPQINFCQAAALFLLARILFGFVAPGMMAHRHRGLKGKWKNMSKEERSEFIEKIHSMHPCFGHTPEKKDE